MSKFSKHLGLFSTVILVAVITGAVFRLATFAPYGSLGSLDGQSLEVDRFTLIAYILLPLVVGLFLIRKRGSRN